MVGVGLSVTTAAFAIWNVVLVPYVWFLWKHRNELLVKARSPLLAICTAVFQIFYADVIWVQELMRQMDYKIDGAAWASVMIWLSCICLGFITSTADLRSSRVVIISNSEQRRRKSKLLSTNNQIRSIVWTVAFYAILGALIEVSHYYDVWVHDYSIMYQPAAIYGSGCLLATYPAVKSCIALRKTGDVLHVGAELVRCNIYLYSMLTPYFILLGLKNYDIIDVDTRVQFFLVAAVTMLTIEVFIISRPRWARRHKNDAKVGVYLESTETHITSITLLNDATLNPLFARYVERNLCYESFQFLQDTAAYCASSPSADVKDQYRDFMKIVIQYIIAGSSLEINISSSLRRSVLRCAKDTVFQSLSTEERTQIFDVCIKEVATILDLNLLPSFQKTQEYQTAMRTKSPRHGETKTSLDILEHDMTSYVEYL